MNLLFSFYVVYIIFIMALTFYENYFSRKIKFLGSIKHQFGTLLIIRYNWWCVTYMNDATNAADQSLEVPTIFVNFESTDALFIFKNWDPY